MYTKSISLVLYGMERCKEIIDAVVTELNLYEKEDICFDIKLILVEALTNAFKHGNRGNRDKPIFLRYAYNDRDVRFEIEDSGDGLEDISIPHEVSYKNLLDENGRGLFLLKSISDRLELNGRTLVVHKKLNCN